MAAIPFAGGSAEHVGGSGLLHARVVRPPLDGEGASLRPRRLLAVEAASVAAIEGVVDVVARGDFVAVVATTTEAATRAARQLKARWESRPAPQPLPARENVVYEHGDTAAASAANKLSRSYRWPALPPLAEESANACAALVDGELHLWARARAPRALTLEIAALTGLPPARVQVLDPAALAPQGLPAPAGRSPWTEHAAADAALLAQRLGRPVLVTLGQAELRWSAALAGAQESRIEAADEAGPDAAARFASYRHTTLPPAQTPLLPALRLAGVGSPTAEAAQPATVLPPPYRAAALRLASTAAVVSPRPPAAHDPGLPGQVFAQESFIDEAARAAGADPLAYRLQRLEDERGATLLRRLGEQAGPAPASDDALLRGRGYACAHVSEAAWENDPQHTLDAAAIDAHKDAWAAWMAEVAVDPRSGEVAVSRVLVGSDAGALDHGGMRQAIADTTGRLLSAEPATAFDDWPATAVPAAPGEIALLNAALLGTEPPAAQSLPAMPEPRLAGTGATLLPAAAAVANAIHDATGVRLDAPPFTAERIRLALEARNGAAVKASNKRKLGWLGAAAAAAAATLATALPWRAPIAPVAPPAADLYSAATLARGELVAAAGDCAVCHTTADGAPLAGGLALETPFGIIYTTNITPDPETGIGNWSYAAFERAMRHGIHRDGRHLYPAFPYTAYAKLSADDMQALYAWLMAQPAVKAKAPETRLAFPYSLRPALAGWKLLYHDPSPFQPDPARSAEWNRGAYLVEGAGHCGACHTPRNALGAEKSGEHRYAGAFAEGWEAPPLNALSHAPVPWTESALYDYLRHGYSPQHGVASGPMAPVVESLAALPDSDIRAIATYLASHAKAAPTPATASGYANALQQRAQAAALTLAGPAESLYDGACAACHQENGPDLFGVKPELALNSNLHSPHPDNLVQIILHGIQSPAHGDLGYMPGFAASLDDRQIADLSAYLRARFAPDKPAWQGLAETVARLRKGGVH
ncbi:c-type cytochrome [Azoarcus indigens]|nr:c-type cytochrome [Azoarcus indigens]